MDFAAIVDIIVSLIGVAIIWIGTRLAAINTNLDSIKAGQGGLAAKIERLSEENDREHVEVKRNIDVLADTLTKEVRHIVMQHSEHDSKMLEVHKDVESCLYELRRMPPLAREEHYNVKQKNV